jgi:hypothetical protein
MRKRASSRSSRPSRIERFQLNETKSLQLRGTRRIPFSEAAQQIGFLKPVKNATVLSTFWIRQFLRAMCVVAQKTRRLGEVELGIQPRSAALRNVMPAPFASQRQAFSHAFPKKRPIEPRPKLFTP